jgi:hypothetical protein
MLETKAVEHLSRQAYVKSSKETKHDMRQGYERCVNNLIIIERDACKTRKKE